jgi:hypothetical protein
MPSQAEHMTPIVTVESDEGKALEARYHNQPREVLGRPVETGYGPHFGSLDDESHRTGDYVTVYLHDVLERRLGYDIPFLLAGRVEDKPEQEVVVVDPAHADAPVPAILMLFRRDYLFPEKHYGLIVAPEDAPAARELIRGHYQTKAA